MKTEMKRRTDLGLGHQSAISITQRRERQAELRLSITLTKTQTEDMLKGIRTQHTTILIIQRELYCIFLSKTTNVKKSRPAPAPIF